MRSIQADMTRFRNHLRDGAIQEGYKALLGYMADLRIEFKRRYPDYSVGGLYQGYLDMSYFAVVPPAFKRRRLKIPIVFNYEAFRFEAWLSAANRQVLLKHWELVKDARWPEYRLVPPGAWADSIVEFDLTGNPDFAELHSLTRLVEKRVAKFINDIERHLSRH